ncbi:ABC transporter substrate-binding protein [Arhodomonas sp. SL1]|uniref:ABC transporter substrate-binding protein n=1 Tax=Arhodomonas sp. SL1 TaxID=3425691 RepID=UPI003F8823F5
MKRLISTVAAVTASAALLFGASAPVHAQEGEAIKVGVIVPLTGRNAVQGEDILRGIQLATKRINEGYDVPMKDGSTVTVGPEQLGGEIELIVEDNESRPASALDAARKLVNVDEVPVVLGVLSSGVAVPTGEFTNKNEVVQIVSASTSPKLRDIGPYFFDMMGLDHLMGQGVAEFAREDSGAERFGSIVANNPFGVGMEIQTCKALEEDLGGECVTTVRYEQGKSDYRPDLRRVVSEDPEAAFYVAYGTDARLILEQAYQSGIELPHGWYAGYMTLWANEVKETPQIAEGIKGLVVGVEGEFYQNNYAQPYEAEFGEAPTTAFGAYAYDAGILTALAINAAGEASSEAIRDQLQAVSEPYEGVTGDKTLDDDGMQVDESYLRRIYQDGELVPYEME